MVSPVQDVSKRGCHPALGRKADTGFCAYFTKLFAIIEIQLRNSVVVCNKQILVAAAPQVSSRGRQRPATTVDTEIRANFFKPSGTEVMKEILSSAVLRILKTLLHHPRRLQMPKVNGFRVVAANEQIQQSITIVVKPDRGVGVHPGRQSGLVCDSREVFASIVVEQFRASPLMEENILEAVVVIVSPDRAH